MPNLEIIGVGFGRTGTKSTQLALNKLGYNCYHMQEVMRNPDNGNHVDFWLEVANGEEGQQYDWQKVFSNYNATIDNPGACVWKELIIAYPHAKVLLTIHPQGPDAWYKSTFKTIYFSERSWEFKFLTWFSPRMKKLGRMFHLLIWTRFLKSGMNNKAEAISRYNLHIEEVQSAVQADRLLIFSVTEGWAPLCKFLKKPIPSEKFPRVNDTKSFMKLIYFYKGVAYLIVILILLLILALGVII